MTGRGCWTLWGWREGAEQGQQEQGGQEVAGAATARGGVPGGEDLAAAERLWRAEVVGHLEGHGARGREVDGVHERPQLPGGEAWGWELCC